MKSHILGEREEIIIKFEMESWAKLKCEEMREE